MRKAVLWVVTGVLIVLVGLLFWTQRSPVSSPRSIVVQAAQAAPPTNSDASRKASTTVSPPPRAGGTPTDTTATPWEAASQEQIVASRQAAAEAMNVVVNFWGQVVDQDDRPLPGVRVIMSVRKWHFALVGGFDATFPEFSTETDRNGKFELRNAKGNHLSIKALAKEGYEAEPRALRGWGYNNSEPRHPDPADPVVLKMWKADIREKLIEGSKLIGVQLDGRAYTMDFVEGICVQGEGEGDVRFALKRLPDVALPGMYDRIFVMDVINGGLVEEPDVRSPMYAAPESGYVARFDSQEKYLDTRGTDAIIKRFYLRSRDGKLHGRVKLTVRGWTFGANEGQIRLEYAVNPSGSRVLR